MEVGETDTERGPVVSRKDREEVMDRRAGSTKQSRERISHVNRGDPQRMAIGVQRK